MDNKSFDAPAGGMRVTFPCWMVMWYVIQRVGKCGSGGWQVRDSKNDRDAN